MPQFAHDAILTLGMLENLAAFPRELLQLGCSNLGDGMLAGLDFVERDGTVWLEPGIVRHEGSFFLLRQPLDLSAIVEKRRAGGIMGVNFRLVLQKPYFTRQQDGVEHESLPLSVIPAGEEFSGLSVGVFSDQDRLKLPDLTARDLYAEYTQPARFRLLQTSWACRHGATFHPIVFRGIASKLQQKSDKTALDCALLMRIHEQGFASMPSLRLYVENQGGSWPGEDRLKIFNELCACLDYQPEPLAYVEAKIRPKKEEPPKAPPIILTRKN